MTVVTSGFRKMLLVVKAQKGETKGSEAVRENTPNMNLNWFQLEHFQKPI